MKQACAAAVVAAVMAVPAGVRAQGGVELYGIISGGLTYVSNQAGHGGLHANSGIVQPSRWGMRGVEDLGSGLKANFVLESGFDVFSGKLGQGGRMFGRQAFVGLSDDRAGAITLGRQYDSVVDYVQAFTATGQWGGLFQHPGDIDNAANSFRISQSIKWRSPDWGGLVLGGLYSPGDKSGSGPAQNAWSVGVRFGRGDFSAGAGYLNVKNPAQAVADGNWTGGTVGSAGGYASISNALLAPFASCPGGPVAGCSTRLVPVSLEIGGVGASYLFGSVKLSAAYTRTVLGEAYLGRDLMFENLDINSHIRLSSAWSAGAGFTLTRGRADAGGARPKYGQVNLFAGYALSRRTDLSVAVAVQRAHGDARQAQVAPMIGAATGPRQVAVHLGLRHRF